MPWGSLWNQGFFVCVHGNNQFILKYFFAEVNKLEQQYNEIEIPNEESVVIYYKIRQQLAKLGKEIEEYIHKPKYCLPFLQPGRLVKVSNFLFIGFVFKIYF